MGKGLDLDEYRARLVKAIVSLETLAADLPPLEAYSKQRLRNKIEGVKLALSYFDEMRK